MERNDERAIVRTWALRGTSHWIAVDDVRWLLALLGATFIAKNRRRREQLGLHDDTCARALQVLRENPGGGLIHPIVVVDGRVIGTWRSKRQRGRLELAVEPFELLSSEVARGVEAEAADISRFLGLQSELEIAPVG